MIMIYPMGNPTATRKMMNAAAVIISLCFQLQEPSRRYSFDRTSGRTYLFTCNSRSLIPLHNSCIILYPNCALKNGRNSSSDSSRKTHLGQQPDRGCPGVTHFFGTLIEFFGREGGMRRFANSEPEFSRSRSHRISQSFRHPWQPSNRVV